MWSEQTNKILTDYGMSPMLLNFVTVGPPVVNKLVKF